MTRPTALLASFFSTAASAYGVRIEGHRAAGGADGMAEMLDAWLPLSYALNALSRSMGNDDLYPFVLAPPVMQKLGLVNELVTR